MGLDDDPMVNWLFCSAASVGKENDAAGSGVCAAQSNAARSAGVSSMVATQLLLVLDTLLLTWPPANSNNSPSLICGSSNQPQEVIRSSSSGSRNSSAREQKDWSNYSWLLLFIGLLQQADTEAKWQLMRQRGGLLLQLLYHAVVSNPFEDSDGNLDYPDGWAASWGGVAVLYTRDVELNLQSQSGEEGVRHHSHPSNKMVFFPPSIPNLVERLLQALFYKALPADQQLMEYSNFSPLCTLLNRSGGWALTTMYFGIFVFALSNQLKQPVF